MFKWADKDNTIISDGARSFAATHTIFRREVEPWVSEGNEILPYDGEEQDLKEQWKQERARAVKSIVVEVDGMQFDGDETSQTRMARAITALNDEESTTWVLADNAPATVTKEQLKSALRLAGEAQTNLWLPT